MVLPRRRNQILASIITGLVLVVVTIWLVRTEGERLRETVRQSAKISASEGIAEGMREAGGVAKEVTTRAGQETRGVAREVVDGAGRLLDKVVEAPGKIVHDVGHGSTATDTPEEANSRQPNQDGPAGLDTEPTKANEPASETPQTESANGSSTGGRSESTEPLTAPPAQPDKAPTPQDGQPASSLPTAEDVIGRVFELGHEVTRTMDTVAQQVLALDEAEELTIGRSVHRQVLEDHRRSNDTDARTRIRQLAAPILEMRQRQGITYTFELLQDEKINAFAHLGGYVYVTTGLLDFVVDDLELQFILAHEIAHVDLKHCVSQLTYAARASQVAGETGATLVSLAYRLIALGYSEEAEYEADGWAYQHLRKVGKTHEQLLAPLKHLAGWEEQSSPKSTTAQDASSARSVLREIENHFATHPTAAERVRRLEQLGNATAQ